MATSAESRTCLMMALLSGLFMAQCTFLYFLCCACLRAEIWCTTFSKKLQEIQKLIVTDTVAGKLLDSTVVVLELILNIIRVWAVIHETALWAQLFLSVYVCLLERVNIHI